MAEILRDSLGMPPNDATKRWGLTLPTLYKWRIERRKSLKLMVKGAKKRRTAASQPIDDLKGLCNEYGYSVREISKLSNVPESTLGDWSRHEVRNARIRDMLEGL